MKSSRDILVILTPGFPAQESETACLPAVQNFVTCLQRQNPNLIIKIIAFQYPFYKQNYYWKGIQIISLGGRNKSRLNRAIIWLRAWKELYMLRRRFTISGILSFWCGECALIGSWFAKTFDLKHICWISGQDALKTNKLVKWIKPFPHELVAMSDFLSQEFFRNHSIRPASVIPNGIDGQLIPVIPEVKDIDILGVGSLIELKRFDLFIQIIQELRTHLPGLRVVICGKGPEERALKQLATELDLTDMVCFMGELPHQEVLEIMASSRMLLHTSEYEGFGAVCVEALACGARVISMHKPMLSEVDGWYYACDKAELVKQALLILGKRDQLHSNKPYTMQNSVEAMMQLFAKRSADEHAAVLQ